MEEVVQPLPWVKAFKTSDNIPVVESLEEAIRVVKGKEEEVVHIPLEEKRERPRGATEVKIFNSYQDFKNLLEEEMAGIRRVLDGTLLSRLEESRHRALTAKRIKEILKQSPDLALMESGDAIDTSVLKVTVNPSPELELEVMEEAMKGMKDKLETLENAKKICESLFDVESGSAIEMLVGFTDGVPTKIILNI